MYSRSEDLGTRLAGSFRSKFLHLRHGCCKDEIMYEIVFISQRIHRANVFITGTSINWYMSRFVNYSYKMLSQDFAGYFSDILARQTTSSSFLRVGEGIPSERNSVVFPGPLLYP